MNQYIRNDKKTSFINKRLIITGIVVVAICAVFHIEAASDVFGNKVTNGVIFWLTSAAGSTLAFLVGFAILKGIEDKRDALYNLNK